MARKNRKRTVACEKLTSPEINALRRAIGADRSKSANRDNSPAARTVNIKDVSLEDLPDLSITLNWSDDHWRDTIASIGELTLAVALLFSTENIRERVYAAMTPGSAGALKRRMTSLQEMSYAYTTLARKLLVGEYSDLIQARFWRRQLEAAVRKLRNS